MNLIRTAYKTKTLYSYGIFISISLLLLLILGHLLIPSIPNDIIKQQAFSLNGKHLKYNDDAIVSSFLKSIKDNNGFLVIGTSESTSIKAGNYYDFLNVDPEVKEHFSVLSGAGRTCGIFIPLMLNHRKEVNSLKIIYMINPVYWRSNLCTFDKGYWNNYNNYKVCRNISLSEKEFEQYYTVVNPYFDILNIGEKIIFTLEYWFRLLRKPFFQDLNYYLNPNKFIENFNYLELNKPGMSFYKDFDRPNLNQIDTSWNISYQYHNRKSLNPISEDVSYRFEELKSFISVTRDLNVDIVYVMGPYNKTFIEKYDLEKLGGYARTVDQIRDILIKENVNFIDATDVAVAKGSFKDQQHHSNYGAYLIYEKIKTHLNETN